MVGQENCVKFEDSKIQPNEEKKATGKMHSNLRNTSSSCKRIKFLKK